MFCSKCGNQIASGAAFCLRCGNPTGTQISGAYVAPAPEPAQAFSQQQFAQPKSGGEFKPVATGLAVAALVVTFFVPLVGLILGYAARGDIDRSKGTKGGRGLASAAIALGWIFTLLGVLAAVIAIAALASMSSSYYYY